VTDAAEPTAVPTPTSTALSTSGNSRATARSERPGHPDRLPRFSRAERALHWATAVLVLNSAITGLILYVGSLSVFVGRRALLKDLHVYGGLAIPVPLVLAYAGRWREAVRRDVRTLARWNQADRTWLRSLGLRATEEVGKFNAGQKANAAFVAGMIPVMLATGSIMRWFDPFPLSWRTGATFVHDWTAIATWLVVTGHIVISLGTPPALGSMLRGWMSRRHAKRHHPAWVRELEGAPTGGSGTEPASPISAGR
jgi:formate dehydrogenase subunit gamma